jgi:hypothetical protein
VSSTNLQFPQCFALAGKKAKKGKKHEENPRRANTTKTEEKMKRKKTKRKQQGCDVVVKVIDTVEQAVSTAKKLYRVIEPVVNALTNRQKPK